MAKLQLQLADRANHMFIREGNKYVEKAAELAGSLVVFKEVRIGKKSQTKQVPINP